MKFFSRVVLALFAVSSVVALSVSPRSNNDISFEFLNALKKAGLTLLAEYGFESNSNTSQVQTLTNYLKSGKKFTLLAPENRAFDSDHPHIDPDVLLYSTLFGSIDEGFKTNSSYSRRAEESHSIAESTFPRRKKNNDDHKRGNFFDKFQVQVIDQFSAGGSRKRWPGEPLILIDRTVGSAKVVNRFTFKKIIVLIIDTVLTLPKAVSDVLCKPLLSTTPNGFKKFGGGLQRAGLLDEIDSRDKITIFAPVDDSCSDFDDLSGGDLSSTLKNHFFFGKIVFTPLFPSTPQATAESGEKLKMTFENDVHFVCCGKTKAIVLRGDVITANGVLHVIDRPLKCD